MFLLFCGGGGGIFINSKGGGEEGGEEGEEEENLDLFIFLPKSMNVQTIDYLYPSENQTPR